MIEPAPVVSHRRSLLRNAGKAVMCDPGMPVIENGQFARQLNEMPDYANPATAATEQRLKKFEFEMPEDPNGELITRAPYMLDNEAVYQG